MGMFTLLYSFLFYLWFLAGAKPTSRITITYAPSFGDPIACSFDVLGKINPEEQQKFEDGVSAEKPLLKMLEIEKKKASEEERSVNPKITAFTFKNEDQYASVELRAGVFYTSDRIFD